MKNLIKQGRERGYVTFEELYDIVPQKTLSPEQIDDILSRFTDIGIKVVETEEINKIVFIISEINSNVSILVYLLLNI